MHSPFSRVKIDTEESLLDKHLLPSNLYSFNSLNDFAKKITPQDQSEVLPEVLNKLVEQFANKARAIKAKNFNELFNALLSLIYQFCWGICADAREEIRDVSLYDHLKTTSALATCLYLFHLETASLNEKAIANENEEKFLLIGGDLSGIQNYLYDIANINAKAVAKRLRARSFRLTLLIESAAVYLLKELRLPSSCLLFSSGGRFELLAPNTTTVKEKLKAIVHEIDQWLLGEYFGQLCLNIRWQPFSPEELKKDRFATVTLQLAQKLERAKRQKFSSVLAAAEPTFAVDFNGKACPVCSKYPATVAPTVDEEVEICKICEQDRIWGEQLKDINYICFFPEEKSVQDLSYSFVSQTVYLVKKESDLLSSAYLSYLLFPQAKNDLINKTPAALLRPIANWQPQGKYGPLTFADLAADNEISSEKESDESEERGFLGVLKADVDNLGFIFSQALGENLTMSRKSNLSTAMDIFFGGFVHLFAQENKLYTVYSGGDDLLLIGKWDNLIEAAFQLRSYFNSFTGQHPRITLSAGLAVVKPKTPIWFFAKQANDLLEKSKEKEDKNSFTCFNATLNWRDQPTNDLQEIKEKFIAVLQKELVSTGFIYSFLFLQRLYEQTGKPFYKPKLAYQLARNLDEDNPQQKELKELIEAKLLDNPNSDVVIKNISFPVSFALLKQRLEKGGNNA